MLRTSLCFTVIALVAVLLADLEISTLDPWAELGRVAVGAATPDFSVLWGLRSAYLYYRVVDDFL